jgi:hypothetical protein
LLSFIVIKGSLTDNALAPIEFILRIAAGFLLLVILATAIAAVARLTLPGEGDEVCDSSPSRTQHLWSSLLRMTPFAYTGGFLVCAFLVSRAARQHGLFSPHVALGTGRLGLYVLTGYVVMSLIRIWMQIHLMLSMTATIRSGLWYYFLDFSWPIAFGGFGLLTIGRVLAQSVRMQWDVDATV